MKSGTELMDAFTAWFSKSEKVEADTPVAMIRRETRQKYAPFVTFKDITWKIGLEGMNRGFDAVYSAVNKEGEVEINIPVEFKSDSDVLDSRLQEQIHRHITVFGVSCVVIDQKEGVNLLSFPKKFWNFIPAYIFVRKGTEFIRVSQSCLDKTLPTFYTQNLHNLLPYGLKSSCVALTEKFKQLDSIMRKIYMENMRTTLGGEYHDPIQFTDDELSAIESLLTMATVEGTIRGFKEAIICLEKLSRWHYGKTKKNEQ